MGTGTPQPRVRTRSRRGLRAHPPSGHGSSPAPCDSAPRSLDEVQGASRVVTAAPSRFCGRIALIWEAGVDPRGALLCSLVVGVARASRGVDDPCPLPTLEGR